jgi:hypothetical protein
VEKQNVQCHDNSLIIFCIIAAQINDCKKTQKNRILFSTKIVSYALKQDMNEQVSWLRHENKF